MDNLKLPIDCDELQQGLKKFTKAFSPQIDLMKKHKFREAAVLVAIFEYHRVHHMILTERSSNLRLHAGHVALPGGKVDPKDADASETALREAEEEIGLGRSHIKVLGHLPPTYGPGMVVTPVVGYLQDVKNVRIVPNEAEVSNVFAMPLELFIKIFSEHSSEKIVDYILWDATLYSDLMYDRFSQ